MGAFLLSIYPWIKGIHIIMVIAWMAGMMYLPRLFIYHHQSKKGGEAEGYFIQMERRLMKGIMTPSMVVVWIMALSMLAVNPGLIQSGWFIGKLIAVLGISGIHGFYVGNQRKFENGDRPKTEKFWRIMNEIPFILLIFAVLLAIVKPF